jgi:hypothetical protein
MAKCDCTIDPKNCPCSQEQCDWYINDKKHFNCFLVYKHFICHKHTLQEIAQKIGVSHTTIKQIEEEAMKKLKNAYRNNKDLKDL